MVVWSELGFDFRDTNRGVNRFTIFHLLNSNLCNTGLVGPRLTPIPTAASCSSR